MRFSALFHSLLMCIAISSVTLTFTSVAQAQTGNRVEIAEGTLGNGNPTDSEHQKNGRVSCVPLNRIAIEALRYLAEFRSENCPDARYVFCNREGTGIESMMRSFATACDNAGIEKIRFIRLSVGCMRWPSASSSSVPSMDIRWVRRRRRDDLAANFAAARSIREVGRNKECRLPGTLAQWPVLAGPGPRQCLAKVPGAVRTIF